MEQAVAINSDYQRSLLQALELFQGVRPEDVQDLLQRCDRRDLGAGELLLSPGAKNEYVFIVLSGSLNVHVGSPGGPVVATMETGACVGEMSIIEDRDPSAYVIGAEDTHLLVIHQSVLWEMVDASHDFAKNLLVVLSERVRSHNKVIADSYGELRKFERHATTDALTGLGNRHSMQDSFPREIARCKKNDEPVSLIMVDVDNFKDFNDRFGHIAGDRALTAVSRILHEHFRPRDVLVRYGGRRVRGAAAPGGRRRRADNRRPGAPLCQRRHGRQQRFADTDSRANLHGRCRASSSRQPRQPDPCGRRSTLSRQARGPR